VTLQLIEDLKLQDKLVLANEEYSKRRFIYNKGSIQPLPTSFSGLFSPLMRKAIIPGIIEPTIHKYVDNYSFGDDS
jgi:protoporphyrinogen oxidase